MSESRPYRRPMDPRLVVEPGPYRAYTLRELTGVAVAIYGAVLFVGLICLARGPEQLTRPSSASCEAPLSILLHLALLAAVVYHVKTWFETLPKTQPKMIVDGKQVPPQKITQICDAGRASAARSLLVLFTLWVAR